MFRLEDTKPEGALKRAMSSTQKCACEGFAPTVPLVQKAEPPLALRRRPYLPDGDAPLVTAALPPLTVQGVWHKIPPGFEDQPASQAEASLPKNQSRRESFSRVIKALPLATLLAAALFIRHPYMPDECFITS